MKLFWLIEDKIFGWLARKSWDRCFFLYKDEHCEGIIFADSAYPERIMEIRKAFPEAIEGNKYFK